MQAPGVRFGALRVPQSTNPAQLARCGHRVEQPQLQQRRLTRLVRAQKQEGTSQKDSKPKVQRYDDDDDDFDVLQERDFEPSPTAQTEIDFTDPMFKGAGNVQEFIRQSVTSQEAFTDDAIGEAEKFLQRQKLMETTLAGESGEEMVAIGVGQQAQNFDTTDISDEEARQLCSEVVDVLKKLKVNRDMSAREALLVVQIEDPIQRANRLAGWTKGVSREDLSKCLLDIINAKIPENYLALQMLHKEMMEWPYLDENFKERREQDKIFKEKGEGEQEVGIADLGVAGEKGVSDGKDAGQKTGSPLGFGLLWVVTLFPVLILLWFLSTLKQ